MKYFFDTEFIEDGKTIDLLSIGVVSEDGRELYCENAECDRDRAPPWVRDNVFPHLRGGGMSRRLISWQIIDFVGVDPEFWAYYGSYDWVVLCQLYGTMMQLPAGWPMFVRDVKQLCMDKGDPALPKGPVDEHNALADARWTKQAWEFLNALKADNA